MAACPDAYRNVVRGCDSTSQVGFTSGGTEAKEAVSEVKQQCSKVIRPLLQVLVEAERCAIRVYTDICNITFGKDHRTYELSLAILNEEIEHEAWFSEFLGEGPSGHFRRGVPGESLHLRFLVVPNSHNGK